MRRAFGVLEKRGWIEALVGHAIQPVRRAQASAGKNTADIELAIAAVDMLSDIRIDGYCLVSSDTDFVPLALRLREAGRFVVGIGEWKTPEAFVGACDDFSFLDEPDALPESQTVEEGVERPVDPTGDAGEDSRRREREHPVGHRRDPEGLAEVRGVAKGDDPGPPHHAKAEGGHAVEEDVDGGVEVVLLPEPDRDRSFRAIRTSLQPLGWHLGESGSNCKLRPGAITISGGKPSNLAVRNGTAPGPAAEKLRSGRNLETNPVPRRRPLKRPRRPGGRRDRRSARAVRSRRSRTRSPPRSAGSPRTGRARRSAPPGGARGSAGGTGRR